MNILGWREERWLIWVRILIHYVYGSIPTLPSKDGSENISMNLNLWIPY